MIKKLKITVLSENETINPELVAEHSLSFLIETDSYSFLFDTGASNNLIKNATTLGIDIAKLKTVVLSHGHNDHTGGLSALKNKEVYIHPDLFIPKYKKTDNNYQYIGVEFIRCYYEYNNQLVFKEITSDTVIQPDITLLTNFTKPAHEDYFYLKPLFRTEYIPDYFKDELVVVLNTIKGLVVITGCAHCGIESILKKVAASFPNKHIAALLGGLHLSKKTAAETKQMVKIISKYAIDKIGISHCTGKEFAKHLPGDRTINLNISSILQI